MYEKSFVIGTDQRGYSVGDYILLTDGFTAIGVAIVLSEPKCVIENISLEAEFEAYEISYDSTIFTYNARVYKLEEQDKFEYQTQQGIVKIGQEEVRGKVIIMVSKYAGESSMSKMVDILRNKKQIIIQGAPGVGKTYATKEIALRIIGQTIPESRKELNQKYSEAVDRGQIVFCTFHQSMDYEDFVEGYKPDIGMNGLPTFELRDGPFKQICRNCLGGTDESAFEEAWEKFIESIDDDDKDFKEAKTVKRNKTFYYRLTENGAIQVSSNSDWNYAIPISKQQVRKFILENNKPYHQSYVKGIAKVLQDEFGAPIRKSAIRKPHVLIIDEINRGNVSKIFGELITLLETDKRESEDGEIGETLSVALTYSQEKMVVPHNLFIIGTMNTADRSLGQIDYALRRRFAFIELNADKAALEQYYNSRPDGPKDRAIFLFSSVEKFLEMENIVNHDFDVKNIMIGHSYFMAETIQALSMKMRYEVIPLLEEYRHDGILNCIGTDDDYLRLLEVLRSE